MLKALNNYIFYFLHEIWGVLEKCHIWKKLNIEHLKKKQPFYLHKA